MKERMSATILLDNIEKELNDIYTRRPDLWGKSRNYLVNLAWKTFMKGVHQQPPLLNTTTPFTKKSSISDGIGTPDGTTGPYNHQIEPKTKKPKKNCEEVEIRQVIMEVEDKNSIVKYTRITKLKFSLVPINNQTHEKYLNDCIVNPPMGVFSLGGFND